jgi:hypothetical protein
MKNRTTFLVNVFRALSRASRAMPDETPSTSASKAAPGGAAPDPTDGPNFGVPEVDWGALKADMIIAANKLGDHLSVLKVRDDVEVGVSRKPRSPPEGLNVPT